MQAHYLDRRRQQRERLRELREAEALQREATAAAYGFKTHHQALDHSNDIGHGDGGGGVQEDLGSRSVWMDSNQHNQRGQENRPRHGWPIRERDGSATAVAEEDEEARVAGWRTAGPKRTWPPKGYLRRQALERDEPRHNV